MYAAKVNDVEQLIHHMWLKLRNRGYYMAARRYEISLRVLKYFFNMGREILYIQAAM